MIVLPVITALPIATYTPAPRISLLLGDGPVSTLFVMMLLTTVAGPKTKTPPPATQVREPCCWGSPPPPMILKPSILELGRVPLGNVTVLHWVPVLFAQNVLSVQGCPAALIVVCTGPPWEITLTAGRMRIASTYVPGATLTVSSCPDAQMASWILQ